MADDAPTSSKSPATTPSAVESRPKNAAEPGLDLLKQIAAGVVLILWLGLFAAGTLIDSTPFRDHVTGWASSVLSAEPAPAAGVFLAIVLVLLCWTPTNLALLCGTGGLVGMLGRFATLHRRTEEEIELDLVNPFFSALFRGLFVYLVVISGVLIIIETPFAAPTQGQYVRLAGLLSLLSFLVNYNPNIFARLFRLGADAVERRSTGKPNPGD